MHLMDELARFDGKPRPSTWSMRVRAIEAHMKDWRAHQRGIDPLSMSVAINRGNWSVVETHPDRGRMTLLVHLENKDIHVVCAPLSGKLGATAVFVRVITAYVPDADKWEPCGLVRKAKPRTKNLVFDPFADAKFAEAKHNEKLSEMKYREMLRSRKLR